MVPEMRRALVWMSVVGAMVACTAFGVTGEDTSNPADAAPGSSPPGDAAPLDAAAALEGGACVAKAGAAMVRIESYCIDVREVTNGDYALFLGAVGSARYPDLPAVCGFKQQHVPDEWPASPSDHPVTDVDWCDAWAYCAWAGKRLCGDVRGGALAPAEAANPARSEWYRACSNAGARAYPYGDTYEPTRCNGPDAGGSGTWAAGSRPECAGGYPGLRDMSGNVYEWEDSCNGATGADDGCVDRGGAFRFTAPDPPAITKLRCDYRDVTTRSWRRSHIGMRCCAG
jgi:formylglycine-generating enzyme